MNIQENLINKFHFVYITTNMITDKQYVGDHSCDVLENDRYLGSGAYIKNAIKKYGKENFKREILEFCVTKEDAFKSQIKYIEKHNTLFPNGYNISPTGGLNVKDFSKHGSEAKRKMHLNAPDHSGKNNGMFGVKRSKEEIQKISIRTKLAMKRPEVKEKMINRIYTEENHKNMSIGQLNREKLKCPHCNKNIDPGNYVKWHGDKCKYK